MKRKLMAFCSAVVVASVFLTVMCGNVAKSNYKTDVSYAEIPEYYNEAADMNTVRDEAADMNDTSDVIITEAETDDDSGSGGLIGGLLGGSGGSSGGIGGAIGGIGDAIGGIGGLLGDVLGGSDNGSQNNSSATYPVDNNIGYIDPVPAVTYIQGQTTVTVGSTEASTTVNTTLQSETLNVSATSNPYQKPTGEIKPGDSGEGVKWIQWMFMYTNYGLTGKPITGVYDEETQNLVKKLQQEKGLTVDGVVNDSVIDKIELLYYQHSVTATTAPQSVLITAPNTVGETVAGENDGKDSNTLGIVIIIVAAIWCVAIGAIIIVYVLNNKKKKNNNSKDDKTLTSQTGSEQNKDMSLSDLFEDANK